MTNAQKGGVPEISEAAIPEWAKKRAAEEANKFHDRALHYQTSMVGRDGFGAITALARYIADHEEPPVDPLLIEARKVAVRFYQDRRDHDFAKWIGEGSKDHVLEVQVALAALRRGIEIGGGK